MERISSLFLIAGSLALLISTAGLASACPDLECRNFTEQKNRDCSYILSQGFSEGEEQELLCGLWEGSYDFDAYQPQDYNLDIDLKMKAEDIETSRIITAGKLFFFGLFNYLIFSITKLKALAKWLTAV